MKYTTLLASAIATAQAASPFNRAVYAPATELDQKIGQGICQAKDGYDVFDLNKFDQAGRDKSKKTSTVITNGANSTNVNEFVYKACQPSYTLTDKTFGLSGLDASSCANMKGNAYWLVNGACTYSFKNSEFDGIDGVTPDASGSLNLGFELKWKSNEKCAGDDDGFKFELKSYCEKDVNSTNYQVFTMTEEKTCSAKATYYGPEACKSFSVNLQKISDAIAPFITWIFLTIGLVLTFAGSRFLLYAVAFLVTLAISGALYLLSYNTFMSEKNATTGGVVGVMVIALILGLVGGYLAFKFAKAWAVSVLAAWAGIAIFVPLTKVLGLTKSYYTIAGAVVGAGLGFYIGKRYNKFVRSAGTAIVGSFLTVRSLGSYIGGYPNETDLVDGATKG